MSNHDTSISVMIDEEDDLNIGLSGRDAEQQFVRLAAAYNEMKARHDRLRGELQTINYRALSAIQAYFDDERESEIYTRMEELQDVLQEAGDE